MKLLKFESTKKGIKYGNLTKIYSRIFDKQELVSSDPLSGLEPGSQFIVLPGDTSVGNWLISLSDKLVNYRARYTSKLYFQMRRGPDIADFESYYLAGSYRVLKDVPYQLDADVFGLVIRGQPKFFQDPYKEIDLWETNYDKVR